jgi:ubiquinone/menaquinone biosynthesis C-methylase UbiE
MSDQTFDRIAAEYDESLPPHVVEHYLDKRVAFVRSHCPRGPALDVGCGTGVLAERLARAGYEMTGVDASQGMLDVLSERAPSVTAVLGSGTELPFDDDRFQLVLSVATLHHIAEPTAVRKTLHEMVRVARPGGRVLIWDHNPRNPYWRLIMSRVPQDDGSERLVGEREIVQGLEEAGAEILLAQRLGFVADLTPPSLMGAAAGVERLIERAPGLRSICAHNVVLAGA